MTLERLEEFGLTEETYLRLLHDIDAKLDGDLDVDWSELVDKYNVKCHPDTLRKASTSIFGGKFRSEYEKSKENYNSNDSLDKKLTELRKERIKLQTANVERQRTDRAEARQEMFYEYIGSICDTLPLPKFSMIPTEVTSVEYLLTIADIHYGAVFESINNVYSPEIVHERFEYLLSQVIRFIQDHHVGKLHILGLGDDIQGILRVNDLKINDSSIVKATVEVSKLIASFLSALSVYCEVDYYHSPRANHTQIRPLGTKASELADEDLEYIIGHYIETLCSNNNRINVYLAADGESNIIMNINGSDIIATHGHTLKDHKNALRNLSTLYGIDFNYCICGHYHGGNTFTSHEGFLNDCELIVAPSFVGSDPYSDSLNRGSKASCLILGFDSIYGHTETYKIILN